MVEPQVRVFVQTRGTARATDYAFLGGAPPQPWWRAYRDATAFDHPTVLVASDGSRWAAYLSGIPSARVDAVGTVVRYTLVLDGPCGPPDAACVTAAVAAWLNDVADGAASRAAGRLGSRLPAALDARFPPDDVQRWLAAGTETALTGEPHPRGPGADGRVARRADGAASSDGVAVEVRRHALAALAALPAPAPAADEPGDWLGAVTDVGSRAAFTARVAALLAGTPGRALLLNLVGGADDAAALLDPDSPVAVLVDGTAPARVTPLRSEVGAKKAPAAAAAPRTWSVGTAAVVMTAVAGVVIAVLAAVVLLLLL